jgi:DNA-binding NarL/FixJ family response regulator
VTGDKNPRVPVAIVAEGKAAVAAYLASHGLGNTEIAEYLDVGSRTVAQYISDLQKGER